VVEDIANHPFWASFPPALEAGLHSCWSEPIRSAAGKLLGTFAIYNLPSAVPDAEKVHLIEQAANFASIALERSQNEAERAELELQLGQSQKMEAIGHLAGGVAHDFNNLLTPIIVYADLLKRAMGDDEKLGPKVEGIIKAAHKARDLTQQLLGFGRKQVMQMQVVDLNEIISTFHSIMRRTLRESIEIDLRLSTAPAVIRADRSKIDQVLLNLAINAQDAIDGNGQVTVETGQVMIDDEYARLHAGMATGRYVLLAVKDTGSGMKEDVLRHIFEPFFTTKQVGQGTGLGLANVYGIVKQHKGYITAQSKVGTGTTFSLYFPLIDESPAPAAEDPVTYVVDRTGNATILLVEDNDMVRSMATDLLEGLGYWVCAADHPDTALSMVRQHPGRIDLLITDVVMPVMNGLQLFEQINAERPDIDRVLYMSGYAENVIVNAGVVAEEIHFLPKPFTVDTFIAKVQSLLLPAEGQ
jgi:signal transduction histidine kinase